MPSRDITWLNLMSFRPGLMTIFIHSLIFMFVKLNSDCCGYITDFLDFESCVSCGLDDMALLRYDDYKHRPSEWIKRGRLDILIWLFERRCLDDYRLLNFISYTVARGHYHIADWILSVASLTETDNSIRSTLRLTREFIIWESLPNEAIVWVRKELDKRPTFIA